MARPRSRRVQPLEVQAEVQAVAAALNGLLTGLKLGTETVPEIVTVSPFFGFVLKGNETVTETLPPFTIGDEMSRSYGKGIWSWTVQPAGAAIAAPLSVAPAGAAVSGPKLTVTPLAARLPPVGLAIVTVTSMEFLPWGITAVLETVNTSEAAANAGAAETAEMTGTTQAA